MNLSRRKLFGVGLGLCSPLFLPKINVAKSTENIDKKYYNKYMNMLLKNCGHLDVNISRSSVDSICKIIQPYIINEVSNQTKHPIDANINHKYMALVTYSNVWMSKKYARDLRWDLFNRVIDVFISNLCQEVYKYKQYSSIRDLELYSDIGWYGKKEDSNRFYIYGSIALV